MTPGSVIKKTDPEVVVRKDIVHKVIQDICKDHTTYDHECVAGEDKTILFVAMMQKYEAAIAVMLCNIARKPQNGQKCYRYGWQEH